MSENVASQYPNMTFPSEYTKQGQKAMLDKYLNGENNNTKPQKEKVDNPHKETPKSNIDLHKLMPLIKSMSKNQSITQNELMKMMLPMLSGGNNSDMNDIMCMFLDKKSNVKNEEIKETSENKPSISSFRRVE